MVFYENIAVNTPYHCAKKRDTSNVKRSYPVAIAPQKNPSGGIVNLAIVNRDRQFFLTPFSCTLFNRCYFLKIYPHDRAFKFYPQNPTHFQNFSKAGTPTKVETRPRKLDLAALEKDVEENPSARLSNRANLALDYHPLRLKKIEYTAKEKRISPSRKKQKKELNITVY